MVKLIKPVIKNLESSQKKSGTIIRITTHFSSETTEVRRQRDNIFKVLKEREKTLPTQNLISRENILKE